MTSLNIYVEGLTVVALLFGSDRPPYVVKNAAYGSPPPTHKRMIVGLKFRHLNGDVFCFTRMIPGG